MAQAWNLPSELDLLNFDPFAVPANAEQAPLALAVQQAAAQVANVMAVSVALGQPDALLLSQFSSLLEAADSSGTTVNLADAAELAPLLGGNTTLAAQLAYSNQLVVEAIDLAGVVAGQLSAQGNLVANIQNVGSAVPFPMLWGTNRSNYLVGTDPSESNPGRDVIRGRGPEGADSTRGRRQKDRLRVCGKTA